MKRMQLGLAAAALVGVVACADGRDVLDPATAAFDAGGVVAQSVLTGPVEAAGQFDAIVDFSTLRLSPTGENCILQVDGRLVFSGTIEGESIGTTTALVFASCEEVQSAPGAHRDVFTSEGTFRGTIAGVPAEGAMLYQGQAQEGRIEGRILASGGIAGVLEADAQVAVGGSYSGSIVVQ